MTSPFSRRSKDDWSSFTFQSQDESLPFEYDPDRRRRDAATIAGGEERFQAVNDFAETGFAPEPLKSELKEQKKKLDDALERGPMDDAIAPLQRMDRIYDDAMGRSGKPKAQPDPFETAHLPYLDAAQMVEDKKRQRRAAPPDDALDQALKAKTARSRLFGQPATRRIEPPRYLKPPEPAEPHAPPQSPSKAPPRPAAATAEADAPPAPDAKARPAPPTVEPPTTEPARPQRPPASRREQEAASEFFAAFRAELAKPRAAADKGETTRRRPKSLDDAPEKPIAATAPADDPALETALEAHRQDVEDLLDRAASGAALAGHEGAELRGWILLEWDGLDDDPASEAEWRAVFQGLGEADREAFLRHYTARRQLGEDMDAAMLQRFVIDPATGLAALPGQAADLITAPLADPEDPTAFAEAWDFLVGGAAIGLEQLVIGGDAEDIRERKRQALEQTARALIGLPAALIDEVRRLPDAPERVGAWAEAIGARNRAFLEIQRRFAAGEIGWDDFAAASEQQAEAQADDIGDIVDMLGAATGAAGGLTDYAAGALGRRGPRMPIAAVRAELRDRYKARHNRHAPDGLADWELLDALDVDDIDALWAQPGHRRQAEDMLRVVEGEKTPRGRRRRGFHEGFRVALYPELRRMGITAADIRDKGLRTPSGVPILAPTRRIYARHVNGERYSHDNGSGGGEGRGLWVDIEEDIAKEIRRANSSASDAPNSPGQRARGRMAPTVPFEAPRSALQSRAGHAIRRQPATSPRIL